MAAPLPLLQADAPPPLLWIVPVASVLAGSLLALLPVAAGLPVAPPLGLLMLLGWRLLRPRLWGAWVALPLGLADDLIGGAVLGTAMIAWTIILLALDITDARRVWRDRTTDWLLAAGALAFAALAGWAIAWFAGGTQPIWRLVLPLVVAILCFPLAARLCAALDRARLRAKRLG